MYNVYQLHFLKAELAIWGIQETLAPTIKLFPFGYISENKKKTMKHCPLGYTKKIDLVEPSNRTLQQIT